MKQIGLKLTPKREKLIFCPPGLSLTFNKAKQNEEWVE
jgi:hypothetical protein